MWMRPLCTGKAAGPPKNADAMDVEDDVVEIVPEAANASKEELKYLFSFWRPDNTKSYPCLTFRGTVKLMRQFYIWSEVHDLYMVIQGKIIYALNAG
jgi:hypothetical protein